MRTLIVVRHGKSDWSGGEPDQDRPLAPRGRRQVPSSASWIARWAAEHHGVDLAVVSPAVRAQQTWELVAAALPARSEVVLDPRVYAAWGRDLVALVRALPEAASTVVLVGHNPGLEELVAELTGEEVALPTSAVAVVAFADGWSGQAALVTHGRPPA